MSTVEPFKIICEKERQIDTAIGMLGYRSDPEPGLLDEIYGWIAKHFDTNKDDVDQKGSHSIDCLSCRIMSSSNVRQRLRKDLLFSWVKHLDI